MRRLLVIAAALAALVYFATPPPLRALPEAPAAIAEPTRGVIHVHTRRSDGSGTPEQIARAAASAGLRFVVLTDHGDGTRVADMPAYHDGVLAIDAVEISTDDGHVIALSLPKAPYPLAGEARDVVDDVVRMGGVAIAAHPGSRKVDLRWTDWAVPIHGLEHLNGDSEWRDEPLWRLGRALLAYPVRPVETLASLFDRDDEVFRHWDALTRTRRVVAMAGADAHGRLPLVRAEEPYRGRLALPIPAYESVFRSASVALPHARLSSDAERDAATVVGEIKEGRLFSSVDGLGPKPRFELTAASGDLRAAGGEVLTLRGPVRIDVAVQGLADTRIVLLRDGGQVAQSVGSSLHYEAEAVPAVYRAQVEMSGAPGEPPVPWIVSNPIYVGRAPQEAPKREVRPAATTRSDVYTDGPAPAWGVEHSSASQAAVDVVKAIEGTQLLLRYALSGTPASHPFGALVVPAGPIASHDRLTFTARADHPMRVSVQLRAATADPAGERWHRSVFVDTTPREISVWFDDMRPRGSTSTPKPVLEKIQTLLFVVDTVNTPVGTAGQLRVDNVRYER